jgi:hypothetical protein
MDASSNEITNSSNTHTSYCLNEITNIRKENALLRDQLSQIYIQLKCIPTIKDENKIIKDENKAMKDENKVIKDINIMLHDQINELMNDMKAINEAISAQQHHHLETHLDEPEPSNTDTKSNTEKPKRRYSFKGMFNSTEK